MKRETDAQLLFDRRRESTPASEQLLNSFAAQETEAQARHLPHDEHVQLPEVATEQTKKRQSVGGGVRSTGERQQHAGRLTEDAGVHDANRYDRNATGLEQARRDGAGEERDVSRPSASARYHGGPRRDVLEQAFRNVGTSARDEVDLETDAQHLALVGDATNALLEVGVGESLAHVHQAQPARPGVDGEADRVVRDPVAVQ